MEESLAASGKPGSQIRLPLDKAATPRSDGTLGTLYLAGLPRSSRISDGRNELKAEGAYVDLSGWDTSGITVELDGPGRYDLTAMTMAETTRDGTASMTVTTIVLRVDDAGPSAALPVREAATAMWVDPWRQDGTGRRPTAPDAPGYSGATPMPDPGVVAPKPDRTEGMPSSPKAVEPDASVAWSVESHRLNAEYRIVLGDIAVARAYLAKGASLGDPRSAFMLAQTFDPDVLHRWGVVGMRSDPSRARALYDIAGKGGVFVADTESRPAR